MWKGWRKGVASASVMLLLCGCGMPGTEQTTVPSATPYPTGVSSEKLSQMTREERFAQTVMRVGGLEVSYGEVVLYMQSTKEEVETLYGNEVWNYALDKDGTTYAKKLKDELLEQIIYTKVVCAQAERLGISLSEDELLDVDEYTAVYLDNFTQSELDYYGITKAQVEAIYRDNLLATKIYESLTLNVDTDVTDEEARQAVLYSMFLAKYRIEEDGTRTTLREEELQLLRERAEQLAAEAEQTEDFYTFAKEHTESTESVEMTVGRGELHEPLEKVAFALQEGELGGLVETEEGYFLLYCKTYQEEDATEQKKIDIILERQEKAFSENYAIWEAETEVWVDRLLWDSIDLTGEKCE